MMWAIRKAKHSYLSTFTVKSQRMDGQPQPVVFFCLVDYNMVRIVFVDRVNPPSLSKESSTVHTGGALYENVRRFPAVVLSTVMAGADEPEALFLGWLIISAKPERGGL